MKLFRTSSGPVVSLEDRASLIEGESWDELLSREELFEHLLDLNRNGAASIDLAHLDVLAPIASQEVWAAGVTYMRSREARMEESKDAGGGDFYDRVYDADRPELFFKSIGHRVIGPHGTVRIRRDATWTVPEPELVLAISPKGKVFGYTIGNDMSSRDIEGENPLYLPQAKTYDGSCALGPCIYISNQPLPATTEISISINRAGAVAFGEQIQIGRIKRTFSELAGYLYRELSFQVGAFLMTGTGIVPPDDFTLIQGDVISISVPQIGTLTNTVS